MIQVTFWLCQTKTRQRDIAVLPHEATLAVLPREGDQLHLDHDGEQYEVSHIIHYVDSYEGKHKAQVWLKDEAVRTEEAEETEKMLNDIHMGHMGEIL